MANKAYWYGASAGFIGISGLGFTLSPDNIDQAVISVLIWMISGILIGIYGYSKKTSMTKKEIYQIGCILIVLPIITFTLSLITWNPIGLASWDPIKLIALIGIPIGAVGIILGHRSLDIK